MKSLYKNTFLLWALVFIVQSGYAQRKMEKLGRGVVATRSATSQIFVSWRLLGTEPMDIGFNIYRSANGGGAVKLNSSVLTQGTNWSDATANIAQMNSYFVKPVLNGVEQAASLSYTLPANSPIEPFFKVPIIKTPNYSVKFIWVGDLDGDGEYDFVFDKQPIDSADKCVILLEAYKRDGTFLWQMNCGPNSLYKYNVEPGSSTLDIGHGDNFTVYDITGDGKAEVIVRTASGVKFSNNATVSDPDNSKQFISVLNGMTGVEISRTPYNNPYLSSGPMNGHMGIAYLDGINPSIIWEAKNRNDDDSFNDMTTAWDWNGSTLVQKWQFITGSRNCPTGHQVKVADVDGDGRDEVIPMGYVIDDDGSLLYSLGDKDLYHGDRFYVGDLDPARPGLEMYGIQQGYSTTGIMWYYCDAKTGKLLVTQKDPTNRDMARGMTGDLDPRYPGYEFHTFVDALYNVSGMKTSTGVPSSYPNLRFWWDGDLGSENLDGSKFTKWNHLNNTEARLYTAPGVLDVGPNTPGFYGDILGDWREEAVYEHYEHNYLMVFTTPNPTATRIYTLPHNPKYRSDMTVRGYSQSHMTDYYLGYDMEQPPLPPIQRANKYWIGSTLIWDNGSTNWTSGSATTAFANGDTVMFDIRGNNADTIKLNTNLSPGRIWAINPSGKNYIISGAGKLTGSMDLIKALPGNFTLASNHDYTGLTKISEGTLSINGSIQSNVRVQAKGNLGGNGTLNGGVVLESGLTMEGGRISPGNGNSANLLGKLTINGNMTVPGKNNFAFDIVPGSPKINDSIIVQGNLVFNGINSLIINFENATPVPGTYTLMSCTGTLTAVQANFTITGFSGVPRELIIESNKIKLKILSQRAAGNIVWKGSVNNAWDFEKTNFEMTGTPSAFVSKDTLLFDDSSLQKSIILNETAFTSGITFNATSNYTISGSGDINGTGDLIKSNTNTVSLLSTNNTYTGKTIVNGGALVVSTISSAGEPSSLGSADVNPANLVVNNASLTINDFCTTNRGMTITGNATLNVPTANSYAIFVGEITGPGTLVKEGSGTLYLTRQNTYSGNTIIKSGTLYLRSSAGNQYGLGTGGTVTIEDGTLSMEDLQVNNQAGWNIAVPAGKNATLNTDGRCALLGSLTGSGTLNVKSPFIRTDFKGNWSAFTGKINILGGDFRVGNTLGYANSSINLTSGAIYTTTGSGSSVTIGELSGTAGTISGTSWIVGAKNTDATFAGTIASNSITKAGTGSWTLTGANTYTGTTTINAGKLIVNNTAGSGTGTGAVTVNGTGTLSGIGTITGTVTVNTGGILAPGTNGVGTLTINNTVTLASGSITEIEVNSTANDKITSTGSVKLNGTLKLINTNGGSFIAGSSYKLFNATTITGKFTSIEPIMDWDTTALRSTGTISLKGIAQSITFASLPAGKKFGDASFEATVTGGASGNPVTIESLTPSIATVSGNMISISGAGSVKIKASQAGSNIYIPATPIEQTLVIAKAQLTVKAIDTIRLVGKLNPKFTLSYSGFVNNNKEENLATKPKATCVANSLSPVGNYPIVVSGGSDPNYSFTYVNGTLQVVTVLAAENDIEDMVTVSPNPTDGKVEISFKRPKKHMQVVIESISGAVVHSSNVSHSPSFIQIDISSLITGVYVLKVHLDDQIIIHRIIKR